LACSLKFRQGPGTAQYLDLAAALKPDLEAMSGCLFIDRFRSLTRENLLLSYQIWQDEAALAGPCLP
jgi:quinol monooxygenase YgiN